MLLSCSDLNAGAAVAMVASRWSRAAITGMVAGRRIVRSVEGIVKDQAKGRTYLGEERLVRREALAGCGNLSEVEQEIR